MISIQRASDAEVATQATHSIMKTNVWKKKLEKSIQGAQSSKMEFVSSVLSGSTSEETEGAN